MGMIRYDYIHTYVYIYIGCEMDEMESDSSEIWASSIATKRPVCHPTGQNSGLGITVICLDRLIKPSTSPIYHWLHLTN